MMSVRGLASAFLFLFAATASAQTPADELQGYWAGSVTYEQLEGELALSQDARGWHAALGAARADAQADGRSLRFAFPGDAGAFRGTLASGGGSIDGFWIQFEPRTEGAPEARPAYASPVRLRRAGGAYRGDVHPLPQSFTLYLRIFRNQDDVLIGAFRNPEGNNIGGASRFRVARDNDDVRFHLRNDESEPELVHDATLLQGPERLRLFWPQAGATLDLARVAPEDIPTAFPRPPGSGPYVYRRPQETGDGWRTARARDVGLDEAAVTRAVQRVIDGDPFDRAPSLIHSMLIARRGRLVVEEYFFGHDRDTPHDLRSAGKTFASVMMGAAMRNGVEIRPETRAYSLLAGMGPFANPDPRKDRITLAHLMTHSAGLACDDNAENPISPGNEDMMQEQREQPNWWKYTLDLPMAYEPGTHYAYCSGNLNLMGAALTTATHTWLPEYFDRAIARPLQFGSRYWNLMPTGEGYLGGGARLLPRDLLKVGQVYLDGGVWRGRRIVDAAWVTESTSPRMQITPETTGLDEETFSNYYGGGADGLAWHSWSLSANERTYSGYAASGNGGQLLIVLPELEMVIVFTGGNYRQGGIWTRWPQQLVADEIIAAMAATPPRPT
jgi:CubicO group peptidase (beta-lactamase class C family)